MVSLQEMLEWLLLEDLSARGMASEPRSFTLHAVGECAADDALQVLEKSLDRPGEWDLRGFHGIQWEVRCF